jgi:hypothetical protein
MLDGDALYQEPQSAPPITLPRTTSRARALTYPS